MLESVLTELHNWFRVRDAVGGIHPGSYTIQEGGIALPFLQDGQYFRIMGSVFNDGLHRYGPDMPLMKDETFDGTIWALAVPDAVICLADEIAVWQERYKDVLNSPYASESFGGYAYSKDNSGGWQMVFQGRLAPYRKLREM